MKKKIKLKRIFVILILIVIIAFIIINVVKKDNVDDSIPDIDISADSKPDEEKPEEITYVNLNTENKILSCYSLGDFSSGQNLTVEQYLEVAYNALNNGYIETSKTTFSEKEINDIGYSIFNVELAQQKSIDGLKYENGKYELIKNNSNSLVLENFETNTAAGSVYAEYEINGIKFTARLNTNTVTGQNYIQSIIKD